MHENPTPLARPGALAGVPLHDLLTGYEEHLASLVHARLGVDDPEPVGRLRADAHHALVRGQGPGRPADGHAMGDRRRGSGLRHAGRSRGPADPRDTATATS